MFPSVNPSTDMFGRWQAEYDRAIKAIVEEQGFEFQRIVRANSLNCTQIIEASKDGKDKVLKFFSLPKEQVGVDIVHAYRQIEESFRSETLYLQRLNEQQEAMYADCPWLFPQYEGEFEESSKHIGQYYCYIMNRVDAPRLSNTMSGDGGRLSEVQIKTLLDDGFKALHVLSELNLIHRDIRPDNMLFGEHLTLIDMGTTKQAAVTSYSIIDPRTQWYGYPGDATRSKPSPSIDWFALGVVALCGYHGVNPVTLEEMCGGNWGIYGGSKNLLLPKSWQPFFKKICAPSPDDRPQSIDEAMHLLREHVLGPKPVVIQQKPENFIEITTDQPDIRAFAKGPLEQVSKILKDKMPTIDEQSVPIQFSYSSSNRFDYNDNYFAPHNPLVVSDEDVGTLSQFLDGFSRYSWTNLIPTTDSGLDNLNTGTEGGNANRFRFKFTKENALVFEHGNSKAVEICGPIIKAIRDMVLEFTQEALSREYDAQCRRYNYAAELLLNDLATGEQKHQIQIRALNRASPRAARHIQSFETKAWVNGDVGGLSSILIKTSVNTNSQEVLPAILQSVRSSWERSEVLRWEVRTGTGEKTFKLVQTREPLQLSNDVSERLAKAVDTEYWKRLNGLNRLNKRLIMFFERFV